MNHTEQENLAQGKAKDGESLEFGFQFWDFNKAALVMSIGKAKNAKVKDKITEAYDNNEELENSYHFYRRKVLPFFITPEWIEDIL